MVLKEIFSRFIIGYSRMTILVLLTTCELFTIVLNSHVRRNGVLIVPKI